MAAASGVAGPDPGGGEPLSADERAELVRLRGQVAEQAKDIAELVAAVDNSMHFYNHEPIRSHGA